MVVDVREAQSDKALMKLVSYHLGAMYQLAPLSLEATDCQRVYLHIQRGESLFHFVLRYGKRKDALHDAEVRVFGARWESTALTG